MTFQEEQDIKTVLDYLWKDEEKHYSESPVRDTHIFVTLKRLAEKIGYRADK